MCDNWQKSDKKRRTLAPLRFRFLYSFTFFFWMNFHILVCGMKIGFESLHIHFIIYFGWFWLTKRKSEWGIHCEKNLLILATTTKKAGKHKTTRKKEGKKTTMWYYFDCYSRFSAPDEVWNCTRINFELLSLDCWVTTLASHLQMVIQFVWFLSLFPSSLQLLLTFCISKQKTKQILAYKF